MLSNVALWLMLLQPEPVPKPEAPELYLKVPTNVTGKVGRMIDIRADTNAKLTIWVNQNTDLDIRTHGRNAHVCSPMPGEYIVTVIGFSKDRDEGTQANVRITVEGDLPPPVPPNPPVPPPVPPGPSPPVPADMVAQFQSAYTSDTLGSAEKARYRQTLIDTYKWASANVQTANATNLEGLYVQMATEFNNRIPRGILTGVRNIAANYMDAALGTERTAAVTAATKTKLSQLFAQFAAALEKVQ